VSLKAVSRRTALVHDFLVSVRGADRVFVHYDSVRRLIRGVPAGCFHRLAPARAAPPMATISRSPATRASRVRASITGARIGGLLIAVLLVGAAFTVLNPHFLTTQNAFGILRNMSSVALMALGLTPFRAVVYATVLAFLLSFLERRSWITPRRMWEALAQGATGALSVIPVMAVAGIIVGVMTLTGLALRLAGIIVDFSNGNVVLTALFSAVVVVLLGLAVPVTASFIISFVVISPALQQVGVEPFAASMFIF
jgi:TRAP-type uncharacterized transport system fused permease subunit